MAASAAPGCWRASAAVSFGSGFGSSDSKRVDNVAHIGIEVGHRAAGRRLDRALDLVHHGRLGIVRRGRLRQSRTGQQHRGQGPPVREKSAFIMEISFRTVPGQPGP